MTEPRLYRVQFDNGEEGLIAPLSLYLRRTLVERAKELYPLPDPKEYLEPLPNSLEGLPVYPPEETSKELLQAKAQAVLNRNNWLYDAVIDAGVVIDTPEGKERTAERLLPTLIRYQGLIGREIEDEWLGIVKFCLITTPDDVRRVFGAACEALESEEIRRGVELFRRDVQRDASAGDHRRKATSRAAAKGG